MKDKVYITSTPYSSLKMSEWQIVLTDPTEAEKITITGYGKDPHHPVDVSTAVKGRTARKLLEEVKWCVSQVEVPGGVDWFVESKDDMYLWHFCVAGVARTEGWKLETNLPELTFPPLSEEEKEMIREQGYVIY